MLKSSGISSEERLSVVRVGNKSSSVITCEFGREPAVPAGMEGSGEGVEGSGEGVEGWVCSVDCVSVCVSG